MTTGSKQLQIPLYPNDIVITERVADFIKVLLRNPYEADGVHDPSRFAVACDVVKHWAVGFFEGDINLPTGVTFQGRTTAPIAIVWEEFGLAHVDDWVREDNHLPELGWEPLLDTVTNLGFEVAQ
ncbi:MAG: hypothetical protein RLZZ128_350 [Actinomycetota bacterium]